MHIIFVCNTIYVTNYSIVIVSNKQTYVRMYTEQYTTKIGMDWLIDHRCMFIYAHTQSEVYNESTIWPSALPFLGSSITLKSPVQFRSTSKHTSTSPPWTSSGTEYCSCMKDMGHTASVEVEMTWHVMTCHDIAGSADYSTVSMAQNTRFVIHYVLAWYSTAQCADSDGSYCS